MNQKTKTILLLRAVRALVGLGFLALLGLLGYHLYEYQRADRIYSGIRQAVVWEAGQESGEAALDGLSQAGGPIDFEALKELGPDCVAWIWGCDGDIDYPVALSADDEWYLNHTVSGEASKAGSIFVDRYVSEPFSCFQTILYGHNMKNGSMFHALLNYKDREYWEAHQYFTVWLENGARTYRVFAVYYGDYQEPLSCEDAEPGNGPDALREREAYLEGIKELSLYDTGVEADAGSELLTLVTCEYSGQDSRMVVYALEINN